GTYALEVYGTCNSVTNSATLVVRQLTTASAFSSATRCVGQSMTFSTTPAGTGPFTFIWRKNGAVISTATNASLVFNNVTTYDAATYSVAVSGACNSVTNSAA